MDAGTNSSSGVGTIANLPSSQCNLLGGGLEIPAPYFTTRFTDFSNPLVPHQCQGFDVVWNVCNSGTTPSAQGAPYQVHFLDDAAPGNDHGLDTTLQLSVNSLPPCACHADHDTFPPLYCNDLTFTATTTHITATLPTETGFPNATGAFTVVLP